jgi:RHH-type proline utilization regulon transcriptional repressor/proline dehydrogenase/delta 1-pyrroline-5-carboxylate dehydrogenase
MPLFQRHRRHNTPAQSPAPARDSSLEDQIQSIGADLLDQAREKQKGLLSGKFWSDKLMSWTMSDPAFKTQLFRFVDVMPALRTPEQIHRHLVQYLTQPGVTPPPFLRAALAGGGLLKGALSGTVTSQIESMAARFVAGTDPQNALPELRKLWESGIAFSIDLLGEACVSDAEANDYQCKYLDLIDVLPSKVAQFPPEPIIEADYLGPIPRANVSVKITSLSARIRPADFAGSIERLTDQLAPILLAAAKGNVSINFDMEQHTYKDLTIALFKRCCEKFDFPAALAMQAYLRSGVQDARDLIEWAQRTGQQVTVRLIKGAYWDQEIIHAGLMNWPVPVWQHKAETDRCFEQMSEMFIAQMPRTRGQPGIKLALGSHNLRSIAHGLAFARQQGLPDNALEFQMLRGMADELKAALVERKLRVREYLPIGQMLPGMAYLVRRLLENTSNESWLRAGFSEGADPKALLARPASETRETLSATSPAPSPDTPGEGRGGGFQVDTWSGPHPNPPPAYRARESNKQSIAGFHNEPPRDFSNARQRDHFARAVANSSVPQVRNDATVQDVERAVAEATKAFPAWRDRAPIDRAEILRKAASIMRQRRDELAAVIVLEAAKPWTESDGDVCETIDFCEFYALQAIPLLTPRPTITLPGEQNLQWHEPRGVSAIISPWNFPLSICCGMTVASLVTGNCAIVKPAEQTPAIASLLCEILWEAGIPRDVLHFLPGIGEVVGAALVAHPAVANIAFTGSKAVGLQIMQRAAETPPNQPFVKRVICEMGGKNAIIVDASADLDEAVLGVRASAFGYAGQKCSACSRCIVLADHYDHFLNRLVESTRALRIGDPIEPGIDVGPVIDDEAANKIRSYIEIGKTEAKLVLPGSAPQIASREHERAESRDVADRSGMVATRLIPPHIFSIEQYDLAHPPRIAGEEIFGPVLTVIRARDLDEALAIANSSSYKLTGGFFSRTPVNLDRVKREFRVGNLYINRGITGALVGRQPFGGFALSGIGAKAGGEDYLRQFTDPRITTENTLRRGFVPEMTTNQ